MKVKKFVAPSTREALQKLRAELGEDAIILSTKQTSAGTEVLAASSKDLDSTPMVAEQQSTPKADPPPSWTRAERQRYEQSQQENKIAQQVAAQRDRLLSVAQAATRPTPPRPAPAQPTVSKPLNPPPQARAVAAPVSNSPSKAPERQFGGHDMLADVGRLRSAAAQQAMVVEQAEVLEEIKQMRQLLKDQMAMLRWRDSLERNPLRAELWNLLARSGFSPLFARTVVERLPNTLSHSQMLEWVNTVLKKNLNVVPTEQDIIETGGVYALVGPTGVGKTTTTAKLAARCVVKYGADSLGLITTDSYRIGAQDQLRIYGKILGIQVYTAQNHTDLQQLRASMQRKRLVLIDTVGMGQRDSRVGEHTKMLTDGHVKRVLLLNATSQAETLDDVVKNYKSRGLSGAILTKLDESIKIACVLDVVMRHKLDLHYIATGQRVPEDLFFPDPRVLIHRALNPRSGQAFVHSEEELNWKMLQVPAAGF